MTQPLLSFALLSQIASDLGKTDQPPVFSPDRVDDDVSPEADTVLTNPPPFRLEASCTLRCFEGDARNAGLLVLFSVKAREVLAYDLSSPSNPLTALHRVPATNAPFGVQHINRVIRYALDEQAEAFLCFSPLCDFLCDCALPRSMLSSRSFSSADLPLALFPSETASNKASVINGDAGLAGKTGHQLFCARSKNARLGMTKK